MGLTNVKKMLALTGPPSARPVHRPNMPPPLDVVVLKHCRCIDCRNFSQVGQDYFCSEYIGGTKVTWATGKRECDPPPDAWHYCSRYHGVQSSRDSDCSLGMDSDCRPARTPNAVMALTGIAVMPETQNAVSARTGMQSGRDSNCSHAQDSNCSHAQDSNCSLGADSKCSLRPDSFCSLRPQVSKDVWVWPKDTHQAAQVGAGSTIAPEAEQLDDDEELI